MPLFAKVAIVKQQPMRCSSDWKSSIVGCNRCLPGMTMSQAHSQLHMQVDDCIRKYMWSRDMMGGLAKLKREGRPMPKSIEEFQQLMGTHKLHLLLSSVQPVINCCTTIRSWVAEAAASRR